MNVNRLVLIACTTLASACSTISDPKSNANAHPRGGPKYATCYDAANALDNAFTDGTYDSQKIAYMDEDGPRCDVRKNVIAVNKHGILRSVYGPKKETTASLPIVEEGLREYLGNNDIRDKKILVFIHGGLVPHRNAVSEAEIAVPWAIRDGYYPIYLVWDSSLNSAYLDYIAYTTDGERNGLLADNIDRNLQNDDEGGNDDGLIKRSILATTRVIGDIGTGIFKAPENYVVQFDNYWERNYENVKSPYRLDPSDFPKRGITTLEDGAPEPWLDVRQIALTEHLHRTLNFPELTFMQANNIGINRGTSWAAPSEYGYHALIPVRTVTTGFSEVGRNSWDNMVRRTRLAMSSPENLSQSVRSASTTQKRVDMKGAMIETSQTRITSNTCEHVMEQANERRRKTRGGFSLAMDLITCVTRPTQKPDQQASATITLAGHSMGAIVANEILWNYKDLNYDQVIYMAAAGSMRDFNRTALPVIRNKAYPQGQNANPELKFHSLMLHPLSESRERMGKGFPPQGSLLEWIDEMFEGPRNFEEKTLGKYRNIRRLLYSYAPSDQDFMNFRVFPVQKQFRDSEGSLLLSPLCAQTHKATQNLGRCHPLKHGEVNDYTYWRDSYLGDF